MNNYSISRIANIVIHNVGNKYSNEGFFLSKSNTTFNKELEDILSKYFFSSLKPNEYYNFYHTNNLDLNEVFVFASKIFENPDDIHSQSINLAKHLYECSTHPKVKGGEFYTVFFENCLFEGQSVSAIGLFKSESKDTFLKVEPSKDVLEVSFENGINVSKLDKGCLIFNVEKANGYCISIVDNLNKGSEALYWRDSFLKLVKRNDNYHNTQNALSLCKDFIMNELPREFEISRIDQASFLNKSLQFFQAKDHFDLDEFSNEVIEEPNLISSFHEFKSRYQDRVDFDIADNFQISDLVVKNKSKVFKSIIKLDRNFHIYIHGNKELISQGREDDGRKFYKIYFQNES